MREELLKLAERCEAATGDDRELDLAIFDACNPRASERDGRDLLPWTYLYTASLDAAMTLVGEGGCDIRRTIGSEGIGIVTVYPTKFTDASYTSRAITPALALCAAALRARAARESDNA